ncbi:hypothetical protein [Komagataeibacter europaeus]|uniref:hypothetical protein n=1 Tax=Komagataeibacter europaeus TaxID=33995 RepID=UPI0015FAF296|nr:hypothetical protein [Komagataeibacter europaeus]
MRVIKNLLVQVFQTALENAAPLKKRRHPEAFILIFQIMTALVFPTITMAADTPPADVTAFIHDAEICQYLAGEWDGTLPDARKKDLTAETGAHCATIDARQKILRRKYRHSKNILPKINAYDFGY